MPIPLRCRTSQRPSAEPGVSSGVCNASNGPAYSANQEDKRGKTIYVHKNENGAGSACFVSIVSFGRLLVSFRRKYNGQPLNLSSPPLIFLSSERT